MGSPDQARELLLPVHIQAAKEGAELLRQAGIALDLHLAAEELVLLALSQAHPRQAQGRAAQQTVGFALVGAEDLEPIGSGDQIDARAEAGQFDGDQPPMQGCQAGGPLQIQGDVTIQRGLQTRQGGIRDDHAVGQAAHSLYPRWMATMPPVRLK